MELSLSVAMIAARLGVVVRYEDERLYLGWSESRERRKREMQLFC